MIDVKARFHLWVQNGRHIQTLAAVAQTDLTLELPHRTLLTAADAPAEVILAAARPATYAVWCC